MEKRAKLFLFKNIMNTPLLEITNLNFSYKFKKFQTQMTFRDLFVQGIKAPLTYFTAEDELPVLKNINLKLYAGDKIALTGVNGAGKTTLCRLLLGLLSPKTGQISHQGNIRGVFASSPGIYPELTGRENATILTHLLYPEYSLAEKKVIIEEALQFSELNQFVDMPYQNYSKGMQNRLYLSLVSARPVDILILDEVFDGADAKFQEKITARFSAMIDKCKVLIFVSHSEENIKRVCNKKYLIQNQEIRTC
jgi:ABC-type polysaccharide/polyol phosphate transport system ATPase subunit